MTKRRGLAFVETGGSVAWFAMDACWMLGAPSPAAALAVPTVLLNVLVFRYAPRTPSSWLVSGAMLAWSCMNVLWMTHDFGMLPWSFAIAKVLLALSALLIAAATVVGRTETLRTLQTRFRLRA